MGSCGLNSTVTGGTKTPEPNMHLDAEPTVRCLLIQPAAVPPYVGRGTVVSRSEDAMDVVVEGGLPAPGASLVVELDRPDGPLRMMATLREASGQHLSLTITRMARPEYRAYPRVEGMLRVRYHVPAEGAADADAWLAGAPPSGPERVPDPFVNFSVSGLQFEDLPHAADGDTVFLSFQMPGAETVWRAVGRVTRVQPIPLEERDPELEATHRIALHFIRSLAEADDALATYTMQMQDEWMGLEDEDA